MDLLLVFAEAPDLSLQYPILVLTIEGYACFARASSWQEAAHHQEQVVK